MLESFEQKALDYYGEVIINKSLIHEAGFGARAIPTYVGEWILSHFIEEGQLTEASRERIAAFLGRYLPTKGQKDEIKNRLLILHEENSFVSSAIGHILTLPLRVAVDLFPVSGEIDPEGGPAAGFAIDVDEPVVLFDDSVHLGQSQPCATKCFRC